MIYDWAKVWTDILGDPKLMRAARKGAKGLELLPWFITFAKEADDDGRLTIGGEAAEPVDFVPLIPGQTIRSITASLRSLEALKILVRENEVLRFAAWELRQERAPSDLPEARRQRVREHRERRRAQRNGAAVTSETGEAVTGAVTSVTADTTPGVTTRRGEESRAEQVREEQSTSPPSPATTEQLRERLPEAFRPDLDKLLSRVANPAAWVGELVMAVEGGTAGPGVTYAAVGSGLHDYLVNGKGEVPEIALLRGYVRRAAGGRRRTDQPARKATNNHQPARVLVE